MMTYSQFTQYVELHIRGICIRGDDGIFKNMAAKK